MHSSNVTQNADLKWRGKNDLSFFLWTNQGAMTTRCITREVEIDNSRYIIEVLKIVEFSLL